LRYVLHDQLNAYRGVLKWYSPLGMTGLVSIPMNTRICETIFLPKFTPAQLKDVRNPYVCANNSFSFDMFNAGKVKNILEDMIRVLRQSTRAARYAKQTAVNALKTNDPLGYIQHKKSYVDKQMFRLTGKLEFTEKDHWKSWALGGAGMTTSFLLYLGWGLSAFTAAPLMATIIAASVLTGRLFRIEPKLRAKIQKQIERRAYLDAAEGLIMNYPKPE
jgi:hypothetical protein